MLHSVANTTDKVLILLNEADSTKNDWSKLELPNAESNLDVFMSITSANPEFNVYGPKFGNMNHIRDIRSPDQENIFSYQLKCMHRHNKHILILWDHYRSFLEGRSTMRLFENDLNNDSLVSFFKNFSL